MLDGVQRKGRSKAVVLWASGPSPPARAPEPPQHDARLEPGTGENYWPSIGARNDRRGNRPMRDGVETTLMGIRSGVRTAFHSGLGRAPERPGHMNGDVAPLGLCGVTSGRGARTPASERV